MIVDAHHHLWDPATGDYPWMSGPFAPLRRRYGIEDLRPHIAAHQVLATVVVQARADLAETLELLSIAEQTDVIAGVVGWVDLTAQDVPEQIDRLRAAPGGAHLVGLRHDASSEPDPDWLIHPVVDANLRCLPARGLTFDLEITTRELAVASTLTQRHPDLRFIVDHAAKPPIAQGWSADWAAGLHRLGASANVWCKVSGLVTEATWFGWTTLELAPYVDYALKVFGVDRLLFGSDWPVCELAAAYRDVVQATRTCLSTLTPIELDAVLRRNAIDCYGLDVPATRSDNHEPRKPQ